MTEFEKYYYETYLPLHRHWLTKLFHFVGNVMTILYIFTIIYFSFIISPFLALLLTPSLYIIYPFAWFSHLVIEKNEPAAWTNWKYAKLSDWKMMAQLLTFKLKLDTRDEK